MTDEKYQLWLKVNRNGWIGFILGSGIAIFAGIIAASETTSDPSIVSFGDIEAILFGLGLGILLAGLVGVVVSDRRLQRIEKDNTKEGV